MELKSPSQIYFSFKKTLVLIAFFLFQLMQKPFQQSQKIDINTLSQSKSEKWFNLDITQVNDCIIRIGVFKGEFHWHKHDKEDEFFFVYKGELFLDLKTETITLLKGQGYTIPKGVLHKTRATKKTIVLMMEKKGVQPKGD